MNFGSALVPAVNFALYLYLPKRYVLKSRTSAERRIFRSRGFLGLWGTVRELASRIGQALSTSQGLGYIKEAVGLPGGKPVARTRVLSAGAVLSSFVLDPEGLRYAEEAIKTARGVQDDSLLGQALAAAAWLRIWVGRGAEARPMIEEAIALLRRADDKLWLQPALMYQGVLELSGVSPLRGHRSRKVSP